MTTYQTKLDAGHLEVTAALRHMGWPHLDCAKYRGLGFDILTRHKDGYPVFLELKATKKSPLTDSERALREMFPNFWRLAWDLDGVLAAIGLT